MSPSYHWNVTVISQITQSQTVSRVMVMDQVRQVGWSRVCSGLVVHVTFVSLECDSDITNNSVSDSVQGYGHGSRETGRLE